MGAVDMSIGPPGAPEIEDTASAPPVEDTSTTVENAPHVDEALVRTMLRSIVGGGLSALVADPDVPDHWRFTDDELADVVPPLTRVINRRPQLRAAVARGDEMAVAVVLASYGGRNIAAGHKAAKDRKRSTDANLPGQAPSAPGGEARGDDRPASGVVSPVANHGGPGAPNGRGEAR